MSIFDSWTAVDQQNIQASLSCLPIYLAGCKQLLIIAGSTYPTRLWCLLECFTYVKMGGEISQIAVCTLKGGDASLGSIDASLARCYHDRDRQHLLAVIETGFGHATRFNKILREIFSEATRGKEVTPDASGLGAAKTKKGAAVMVEKGPTELFA